METSTPCTEIGCKKFPSQSKPKIAAVERFNAICTFPPLRFIQTNWIDSADYLRPFNYMTSNYSEKGTRNTVCYCNWKYNVRAAAVVILSGLGDDLEGCFLFESFEKCPANNLVELDDSFVVCGFHQIIGILPFKTKLDTPLLPPIASWPPQPIPLELFDCE